MRWKYAVKFKENEKLSCKQSRLLRSEVKTPLLDKNIPYYNVIMRRRSGIAASSFSLPSGYTYAWFEPGNEKKWAEIETSVGEFTTVEQAHLYFREHYLPYVDEVNYLHTQTWSYKAIGLYIQAGFEILENESFNGYQNDYEKAMPFIEMKLRKG
ncbi:hypothetical protein BRE01_55520 [Brevibacillus reuszeri]|uniref:Uncharacterized protein n=2 Tax=Brevibacillus reuszeri TaxID=54915 RepID=A0ABQ0TVG1_9BACL|nr:hypothetical protein BRE01_55520 [Brevibacillus reuszeri]